ncbi:MAG: ABC transporter ATP-binding protein, partial [Rhizobiales bacterium]|nr:ABC transporter ATP-binding protein [Hyphomicrobiales bacterium]
LKAASPQMRQIRGGRISMIFQEPMTSLSPLHTIGDQIGESYRLHTGADRAAALARAREMLELVGFPHPARSLNSYPFELSGGLRQRAMIAMALICEPALLIADEPTTALDVTIQAQILKLISDLQSELGMAVLMITHDLGVVANMAEEIVVMYHGEIMETGTRDAVFRGASHPYLSALLKAVPRFHMEPGERLRAIREIKPADDALAHIRGQITRNSDPGAVLEVSNLVKRFGQRKSAIAAGAEAMTVAVDDVSFNIDRGECVGLVGESGCGKTTTAKMIMRALSPDEGAVRFACNGSLQNVHQLSGADLLDYRRRVQFIFQDPFSSLNPRMTVFDILSEPLVIHSIGTEAERAERAKELMSLVGLDPRFLRRYPHSFSGGQRQRIGIARALALNPELIICDEPVSALDVSVQAQVLNLLKDLQSRLGLTMLFISHNLAVIDYMADRILVMCRGHLVETGPSAAFFANPQHPYSKALLAAVPEPDPDRSLDLSALMEGRASDPTAWPQPFTLEPGKHGVRVEIETGHTVLYNDAAAETHAAGRQQEKTAVS